MESPMKPAFHLYAVKNVQNLAKTRTKTKEYLQNTNLTLSSAANTGENTSPAEQFLMEKKLETYL